MGKGKGKGKGKKGDAIETRHNPAKPLTHESGFSIV